MADYKIVQKLDDKLAAEGIIDTAFSDDFKKVHSMLNAHYKKSGAALPAKMFAKNEARLRKWLSELYKKGASQERLTSYLRCGLAHLSFDFIESSYKTIDKEDLLTRALLSFKNREFHKTYYKATDTAIFVKKKRKIKKKASGKINKKKKKAAKKSVKKKKAVKKSSLKQKKASKNKKIKKKKKKIVRKKTSSKKSSRKKSPVKKKRIIKLKLFNIK
jgi:hypothetical protein